MVLVAMVLFALLVFSAIAVDVAALVQERRTLQNGADAAALAVAQDCAGGSCGNPAATATTYAGLNADDGAAAAEVCGRSQDNVLVPCDGTGLPSGNFVRVTTRTRTPGGDTEVPFSFGRVAGLTGQAVSRTATVAWGMDQITTTLPVTISQCEWEHFTNHGATYVPNPHAPGSSPEVVLYLHHIDKSGSYTKCSHGPSGFDAPGGFGWLEVTKDDCRVVIDANSWVDAAQGDSPPSPCRDEFEGGIVGTVVHVPVFDKLEKHGELEYRIAGFAAFYVTAYAYPGAKGSPKDPCAKKSDTCISGYFVKSVLDATGGASGSAPDFGFSQIWFVK
jgi:hypothetical protein